MAASPPRRSSRARSTHYSSSHHSSSSSVASSGRPDRGARATSKLGSPTKSPLSDTLSDPPNDAPPAPSRVEEMLQTRHRKRAEPDDREKIAKTKTIDMANGSDEVGEDDEAVRCICGFDEYPGVPPLGDEAKSRKPSSDHDQGPDDDVSDDLAGFFLQCDTCKVWQHGGCVGIKNADMSPDEYFCEECRKDLHKIFTAPNGQRYSNYLPLHPNLSRNSSRAASLSKDGTRSPKSTGKNGRNAAALHGSKRRSTMNSRDAAYDEEEQMRKALEASMKDKGLANAEFNARRGKRGRSDSEEKQDPAKRPRTASHSPPPPLEQPPPSSNDSDDGSHGRSASKKIRTATVRTHKEKELQEKERMRQEAANKRKGRADRRRGDDSDPSDPSDEVPLATRAAVKTNETSIQPAEPPTPSQALTPDTPPPNPPPLLISQRKSGRPPTSRRGKPGKNQYTKDRDNDGDESPHRSQSRDVSRDEGASANTRSHEGKGSRGKGSHSSKITMQDMKKRVAGILAYISRIQIEMAGESSASSSNGDAEGLVRAVAETLPIIKMDGEGEAKESTEKMNPDQHKDFKDLSILEMMDYLTRELVKWQNQYT